MVGRRAFLRITALSLALGAGGYSYLYDRTMVRPPEIPGKILVDLHAHVSNSYSEPELRELLSWGVTGLARRTGHHSILTYEQALGLEGAREIDRGRFASLTYNGHIGYFMNNQEINSRHHVLAVGCNRVIPNNRDPRRAIEEIHNGGELAIVAHLFISSDPSTGFPRVGEDEAIIKELYGAANEVEVFTAGAVNFFPIRDFNKANKMALQYVGKNGKHKGIAVSDAHGRIEQVKVAGIHVDLENLCLEAIYHYLKTGQFERFEQYISRFSAAESLVDMLKARFIRTN